MKIILQIILAILLIVCTMIGGLYLYEKYEERKRNEMIKSEINGFIKKLEVEFND